MHPLQRKAEITRQDGVVASVRQAVQDRVQFVGDGARNFNVNARNVLRAFTRTAAQFVGWGTLSGFNHSGGSCFG